MNYRQMKKYTKQVLSWWDIGDYFEKYNKKYVLKDSKKTKNKKHLIKKLENC